MLCAELRLGQLKEEKTKVSKTRKRKTKWKRTVDQEPPNPKKKSERSNNKKKTKLNFFVCCVKRNHTGMCRLKSITAITVTRSNISLETVLRITSKEF